MKKILLIIIGISGFLSADLMKVGNIIDDSKTGLQWQDNSETSNTQRTWQGAIDYCEELSLDTYDNWRLPNINELKSLIDKSKINPAIRENIFEYISTNYYWSSTSIVNQYDDARMVNFYNGRGGWSSKKQNHYVRCVRDKQ